MRRLLYAILLAFVSCQPLPAQEFPEYWKLPFGYIGSKGSVNFPQGRFWLLPDTTEYRADTLTANALMQVLGPDTLTISHSGDSTHYATTASNHHFNKNLFVDGDITGSSYYGGLYVHDDAGITVGFAAPSTWYTFTHLVNGMLNGFTADSANGTLTSTYPGVFALKYVATGVGQNNHIYHCAIFRNDSVQVNTETHMKAAAGETHTMTGIGHIQLLAGSVLKLKIQDASGTGNGTVYNVNINLERIGN